MEAEVQAVLAAAVAAAGAGNNSSGMNGTYWYHFNYKSHSSRSQGFPRNGLCRNERLSETMNINREETKKTKIFPALYSHLRFSEIGFPRRKLTCSW